MNQNQAIKEQIILLASFAGREMNQLLLSGYMNAISDLDPNAVLTVLRDWLKTSKGFPHPSDVRDRVKPEISAEDDAQDVANLVIGAVGRFGYTNPLQARKHVGELAWTTISRMGGWKHLCETLNFSNEGTLRAQIRDYAQTVRRKAIRGELDDAPGLPAPETNIKKLIGETF